MKVKRSEYNEVCGIIEKYQAQPDQLTQDFFETQPFKFFLMKWKCIHSYIQQISLTSPIRYFPILCEYSNRQNR